MTPFSTLKLCFPAPTSAARHVSGIAPAQVEVIGRVPKNCFLTCKETRRKPLPLEPSHSPLPTTITGAGQGLSLSSVFGRNVLGQQLRADLSSRGHLPRLGLAPSRLSHLPGSCACTQPPCHPWVVPFCAWWLNMAAHCNIPLY